MAASAAGGGGDDDRKKVVDADIVDEDELFELDIALLDGGHRCRGRRYRSAAVVADDGGGGGGGGDGHAQLQQRHALLANCLLPAWSVSKAVPVDASSALSSSSSYPYSGYYSSRRLVSGGGVGVGVGVGRRFLLGRRAGNSARFSFSARGFDAYFQRY
jgi:hypothetical protein